MEKISNNKKLCVLSVFLSGCFWGITGIFVRLFAKYGFNSLQVACMRSISAPIIMTVFALIKNRSLPRLRVCDIPVFIGSGVISVFLTGVFYFAAIERASVSVACILMYTAPIFVIFFSYFIFKEKPGVRKLAATAIAFSGCVLVSGFFGSGEAVSYSALLFGIGSGISYALYSIFSKIAINRGYTPFDVTFFSFLAAGVVSLFICDFPHLFTAAAEHKELILYYPLTGLAASVIPYLLYTLGLSGLESGIAAVISCSEPMVACLVSVFVLAEPITLSGIVGIVLIMISVVILS